MNEPEPNAGTPEKASSLHEVGRRLGRFRVSFALMDEWPTLLPVMGQVVVVRAECRYDSRTVDYVAYSHHFDVVEEGVEPPEYTATFTRHENGLVTVKWERAKDWRHESPTAESSDGWRKP